MATPQLKAETGAGFVVGASCPGCGGDVELSHDFFVTACRHCGSVLRLVMPAAPPAYVAAPRVDPSRARVALDRYLKEQGHQLTSGAVSVERVLYPYWKLDALAVKVRTITEEVPNYSESEYDRGDAPQTTSRRTVALAPMVITAAASHVDDGIPATLGLRADYLKLSPFEIGDVPDGYRCFPLAITADQAWTQAQATTKAVDRLTDRPSLSQHRTDLAATRASIIFMPYLVFMLDDPQKQTAVVDGISGRVVSYGRATKRPASDLTRTTPLGKVGLELHRCTSCGEDLPKTPSLVYFCGNCSNVNLLGETKHVTIRWARHTADDLLVPFWSYADSVVPAFRIANVEGMFRLSRRMTGAKDKIGVDGELSSASRLAPVAITPHEAAILRQIMSFRLKLDSNPKAKFEPIADQAPPSELLFVPFRSREYFWVDTVLDAVSFERAILR